MKRIAVLVITATIIFCASSIFARDAARDLRKMIGYTIILSDTVDKLYENSDGEKFIKLSGGQVFKVDFLLLDPIVLTDVIVFAKAPPKDLVEKYEGNVPERLLYSYKLLIDNEVHDATPH